MSGRALPGSLGCGCQFCCFRSGSWQPHQGFHPHSRPAPLVPYTTCGLFSSCPGCRGWFNSRSYHHTGMTSMWYAMREALAIVAEQGLESMWARHEAAHKQVRHSMGGGGGPLWRWWPGAGCWPGGSRQQRLLPHACTSC